MVLEERERSISVTIMEESMDTTMVYAQIWLPAAAVTVAVPTPTACTTPLLFTVSTLLSSVRKTTESVL